MKISLEEALKRATPGPLDVSKFADGPGHAIGFPYIGSVVGGDTEINAALLAHCFNHFPEAVDLLERHCTGFSEEGSFVKWHEDLARFLAKASTVELPD